jgi:hypothetical protein
VAGFRGQGSDQCVHLLEHVRFVGAKYVVIRMRQPNHSRRRQALFERLGLRSLKSQVTLIRLSAFRGVRCSAFVRKRVDGEDGNVDPRVFLPTRLHGVLDRGDLAFRRREVER